MYTELLILLKADKPDEFIDKIHKMTNAQAYQCALELQSELYLPSVLNTLFNLSFFQNAHSILDLGCGPATLLARLCHMFPEKNFHGIDKEAYFITEDKKTCANLTNCNVGEGDLFALAPREYDFLIMIAVLQHLGPVVPAMQAVLAS